MSDKPDFAQEFRAFLQDPENQTLLRNAICAPLMDEIKELKGMLQEKDVVINTLCGRISAVEEKNDELEQYSRRNSVRISGVPEPSDHEDCYQKVLDIANNTLQLDPPLAIEDIDRTHRVGTKQLDGTTRPILVKFATYRQRYRVVTKRNLLPKPLYINEDLTSKRATLMWKARQAKRAKKISDCWSVDGRLFIRTCSDTTKQIKTEEDLETHSTNGPPN